MMKKIVLLNFFVSFFFCFISCGPVVYKSPSLERSRPGHKTIAILPAEIIPSFRAKEQVHANNFDAIADLSKRTAFEVQDKMFRWMVAKADKLNYNVSLQDVTLTNSLLREKGITYEKLPAIKRDELARILGVDAVVQNRTRIQKPFTDVAGVAVEIVTGLSVKATKKVHSTLMLNDGKTGELLWKLDSELAGGAGSTTSQLVELLMRKASMKFPYRN